MKKRNLVMYSTMGLLAVGMAMMPESAFAQTANTSTANQLFQNIEGLIKGNLGVVIGLVLSLFGLWMWLVQQATWGLVIVIVGAALSAFPGIYGSLNQGIRGAFSDSRGSATEAINTGNTGSGGTR